MDWLDRVRAQSRFKKSMSLAVIFVGLAMIYVSFAFPDGSRAGMIVHLVFAAAMLLWSLSLVLDVIARARRNSEQDTL